MSKSEPGLAGSSIGFTVRALSTFSAGVDPDSGTVDNPVSCDVVDDTVVVLVSEMIVDPTSRRFVDPDSEADVNVSCVVPASGPAVDPVSWDSAADESIACGELASGITDVLDSGAFVEPAAADSGAAV